MLRTQVTIFALAALCLAAVAEARDSHRTYPIADVLENPAYETRLAGVKFYFGDQKHPAVARELGEYQANKKTNAFNKSDQAACNWAFLSALLSLHARAIQSGGDAVIGIRGYYKKRDFRSETEYQCGAGNIMAGVTLVGEVVKLEE